MIAAGSPDVLFSDAFTGTMMTGIVGGTTDEGVCGI